MKLWQRRLGAGILVTLACAGLAARASAQYREPAPPPTEPLAPEPRGPGPVETGTQGGPSPTGAANAVRFGSGWDESLVLEGVHEDNVSFLSPAGPSDVFGSLSGSLARWYRTSHSELRLGLDAGGYVYRTLTDHNRFDWASSLHATKQLSPKLWGAVTAGFSKTHGDTDTGLVTAGVLLPPVATTDALAGFRLSRQVSPLTTLTLSGDWQRVQFASGVFLDMTQWSGGLLASRRVSIRDSLGVAVSYMRWSDRLSTRDEPVATLNYTHSFVSGLVATISAGAGHSQVVQLTATTPPGPSGWQLEGSAGLTGRIRHTLVTASYQHGVRPTIGTGLTEVNDGLTFASTTSVGRWVELIANGTIGARRTPAATDSERYGDVYFAVASRVKHQTRVVLGYRLRKRTYNALPTASNDRLSLSLVWRPGAPGTVR